MLNFFFLFYVICIACICLRCFLFQLSIFRIFLVIFQNFHKKTWGFKVQIASVLEICEYSSFLIIDKIVF